MSHIPFTSFKRSPEAPSERRTESPWRLATRLDVRIRVPQGAAVVGHGVRHALGTTGDALHAAKLVVGLAKLVVARDGGRSGGLRDFSE